MWPRLVMMMSARFLLSLRNVEAPLLERGLCQSNVGPDASHC
jgi:hypothetical protein